MQESRPKIAIDFRAEMNIFNDSFDHKLMPTDSRKSFLLALDSLLPNYTQYHSHYAMHHACNEVHGGSAW